MEDLHTVTLPSYCPHTYAGTAPAVATSIAPVALVGGASNMAPLTDVPAAVATHGAVVAVSTYMALRCCTTSRYEGIGYISLSIYRAKLHTKRNNVSCSAL